MFEVNKDNIFLKINYFISLLNTLNCEYYNNEINNLLNFLKFCNQLVDEYNNENDDTLEQVKEQLESVECEIETLLKNINN